MPAKAAGRRSPCRLPALVPREKADALLVRSGQMPRLTGANVLVVDDDPDAREILRTILEDAGARVTTSSSASETRDLVSAMRPDLLIADIGMPDEDGYSLIIKVYNIGSGVGPSGSLHNMPEVTLNLPGRDQKIEEYLNYIRYLGKAGIPYSHLRSYGQRHLAQRADYELPRGYYARDGDLASPDCARELGREDLCRAALPRPRVHQGRDLGELHLLHQEGGPGGRGGGRANRHSPGRPAASPCWPACRAASSPTSKATSGPSRSPTARTSACACAADPGWKAAR